MSWSKSVSPAYMVCESKPRVIVSRQVFIKMSPFIEDTKLERRREREQERRQETILSTLLRPIISDPWSHRLPYPAVWQSPSCDPTVMRHTPFQEVMSPGRS